MGKDKSRKSKSKASGKSKKRKHVEVKIHRIQTRSQKGGHGGHGHSNENSKISSHKSKHGQSKKSVAASVSTRKKASSVAPSKPPEEESKIDLEIHAEMALLQEAQEGKTPEGFAGKKYQEEKKRFVQNIIVGCFPIRMILMATGRFPLSMMSQPDGTYTFTAKLKSVQGVYFILTSMGIFYILLMGTFTLTDIILDVSKTDRQAGKCDGARLYELVILDRNIVSFTIVWTALCHTTVASVNMFFKREYFAKYLSFWTVAVHSMHVDVAKGLVQQTIIATVGYFIAMLLLGLMLMARFSAILVGTPALLVILQFNLFIPCLPYAEPDGGHWQDKLGFDIMGSLLFMFVLTASKSLVFLFWFVCKMLRRAFVSWNGRFEAAILRTGGFVQSTQGRTTFQLLFKDHVILLDLLEGTDRFFGSAIEAYMSLQLVSLIMEFYFLLRVVLLDFDQQKTDPVAYFWRPRDGIPGMIILLVNLFILICVLKAAAEVGEEATAGLEVIRRRTMLGKRSDEELFFTVSMFSSYTCYRLVCLRGAGYLYLDKELLISVISIFLSYFIVTYQFDPKMDYDYTNGTYDTSVFDTQLGVQKDNETQRRAHIQEYLHGLEQLPPSVQKVVNKLGSIIG